MIFLSDILHIAKTNHLRRKLIVKLSFSSYAAVGVMLFALFWSWKSDFSSKLQVKTQERIFGQQQLAS